MRDAENYFDLCVAGIDRWGNIVDGKDDKEIFVEESRVGSPKSPPCRNIRDGEKKHICGVELLYNGNRHRSSSCFSLFPFFYYS